MLAESEPIFFSQLCDIRLSMYSFTASGPSSSFAFSVSTIAPPFMVFNSDIPPSAVAPFCTSYLSVTAPLISSSVIDFLISSSASGVAPSRRDFCSWTIFINLSKVDLVAGSNRASFMAPRTAGSFSRPARSCNAAMALTDGVKSRMSPVMAARRTCASWSLSASISTDSAACWSC